MQPKTRVMEQVAEELEVPFINVPSEEQTQSVENSDVGVPFINTTNKGD